MTRTAQIAVVGLLSAVAYAKPIPVEVIGRLPLVSNPQISPNAQHVAMQVMLEGKPYVITRDLTVDGEVSEPVKLSSGKKHFMWFEWANDERLIVRTRDAMEIDGRQWNFARLSSVSRDGADFIRLKMKPNGWGFYWQAPTVVNWLKDDPDHILATLDDSLNEWLQPHVHRVNVHTGERELIARNRRGFSDWVADDDGNVRIGIEYAFTPRQSTVKTWYRASADDDWTLLQNMDYLDSDRLKPIAFHPEDPNALLVTSAALDPTTGLFDNYGVPDDIFIYDLVEGVVTGPYIDSKLKKMRDLVEDAFPGKEVELTSHNEAKDIAFFRVHADTYAPEHFLLDLPRKRLDYVASEYPGLDGYKLAPMQAHTYVSRDGLEIPTFITVPVGADGPVPTVVMPHGGPYSHDEWGFNNYVQFLASRGYAVLQPQFRGSTGYGIEHEMAGYGQWGKAMQDDITDGVLWLIEQGIADPERVCIFGASYGGYAAAMGAASQPELYACAISVNAPFDLELLVDSSIRSELASRILNTQKEAATYSPYELAEKIETPMLIIAGEDDSVVRVKHSRRMHQRLKKHNKPVQYLELEGGEHWRSNEAHELRLLAAIEKFLARHLDAPAGSD